MADVFLSYARSSARSATRVADALRAAGYSVWYDESLPAHRAYSEVIEEQLETALAVLVLWSKEASQSHWVRSEANRARETQRLVQVRLDDARLPMPFDQIQCADLRGWRRGNSPAWQSVLDGDAALAGDQGPTGEGRAAVPAASPSRLNRRQIVLGGSGVVAVTAGGIAAWFIVVRIMALPSSFLPEVAASTILFALVLTVGIGLVGTWRVLGHKAAPVLRNL